MTVKRQIVGTPESEAYEGGVESACYARLSDLKKGRESSIEDQVRECREEARRDGGFIPDSNVFPDRDIRGITESRPALDRLLALVRSGKATFKDLYISDTSRLARSASFAPKLRKFFKSHGIRLHFVENGMKSGNSGFDLQHHFQSFFDELFSEQLGEKISRAQVGLALKGYNPCGKCYGYLNVPEEHPTKIGKWGRPAVIGVKQVPLKSQVDVVLDIFKMYANGEGGYCDIARKLRERGIDSPRKGAKNEGRGWCESTVMTILNNERYIGRVTFRKTKLVRDSETLKLKQIPRDESERITYHDPLLQIVSDELWEKVMARQALVGKKIGPRKAGGMARTAASRRYLFSGLLYCGNCGASMVMTKDKYACSNDRRRWGCTNPLRIRRESLERQLTEAIASSIRSEANLTEIKGLFMSELARELEQQKASEVEALSQKHALAEEKRQLEVALRNLAEEVANYGGNDALRAVMRSKSARLATVTENLKHAERPATIFSEAEIDSFLRDAFTNLADVLLGDPITAKQELLKRISSLTLTPIEQDGEPAFALSGDLTLFSEEESMMLLPSGTKREEHHPSTFTLDGLVLKLDTRSNVVAITGSRSKKTKEIPRRQASEPAGADLVIAA